MDYAVECIVFVGEELDMCGMVVCARIGGNGSNQSQDNNRNGNNMEEWCCAIETLVSATVYSMTMVSRSRESCFVEVFHSRI